MPRPGARPHLSGSARVYLATLAAYLTADFIAPVSGSVVSGVDPGTLVVPFCAAFALAFPLWGRAADRRRAGAALAASLVALAASGVLLAVAPSVAVVVAARALEGAAAAGVPPTVQALLAARAGDHSAGRAVSGMMIIVAVATLGGPAIASALVDPLGWRLTTVLLGVLPAAAAAVACAPLGAAPAANIRPRLRATRALVAGWACSTLVLAAYWTLLTRWQSIADGVGIGSDVSGLLPVAGAAGIPLVMLAGRSADRLGPRAPMIRTMAAGAAALAVAAATNSHLVFLAGACTALALYWSYLPVVSVQIQRSAPADARASAAGVLYSSMWLGAALGGLAAVAAPSWRVIVGGAALSWGLAAVIAWFAFLRVPSHA
jgi:predicted MFS family arabinose efflux permease